MVRTRLIAIFILSILFIGGFSISDAHAQGVVVGASPGSHLIENAVQDISVYRDITISRSGNMGEVTMSVGFSGDASEYFKGDREIVIPEGDSIVTYTLEILPTNAPNGSYQGYVDFAVTDVAGDNTDATGAVLVRPGVAVRIDLVVQDEEILDVTIGDLIASDTEKRRPLFVTLSVRNDGNIIWQPEKIDFILINKNDKEDRTKITVGEEELPKFRPGLDQRTRIALDHELDQGEYTLQGQIFYRGELFKKTNKIPVQVYPEGHFARKGEFVDLYLNKETYVPGENVKISGEFRNIGGLATQAVLALEVFDGNQLVDILTSDEVVIETGEVGDLSVFTNFEEYGTYTVVGKVEYDGRSTELKQVDILVPKPEFALPEWVWLVAVIVALAITAGAIIFLRRMRKKDKKDASDEPYVQLPISGQQ